MHITGARRCAAIGFAACAAALATASGAAAQRPARQGTPIEIRGQVPTPQVVTVRPRAVPQYDARTLVPRFYNPSFWSSILPGYRVVTDRQVSGVTASDTLTARGPVPTAAEDSLNAEIEALRRELERRSARLDSIENLIRGIGRRPPADTARPTPPPRSPDRPAPRDSTRVPPLADARPRHR
ncbi:MAG TPA: hypothetical protein VFK13_11455 [Gemmatimonadaceae bacterium]|nr:hypothetical protein [Gemmatimonadaceae bacterium]